MRDSQNTGSSLKPDEQSTLVAFLQDTVHIGIALTDESGRFVHVNRGMCQLLVSQADDLIDRNFSEFVAPNQSRPEIYDETRFFQEESQFEILLTKTGGTQAWASIWRQPITLEDGNRYCLITAVDISERKKLEENRRQLEALAHQREKREILNLISSTIAHRINNLLTPILGYADLARELLPDESSIEPMLQEVITTARQASEFAQQLLALANKGNRDVNDLELSQFILEMRESLTHLLPGTAKIRLEFDLAQRLPLVRISTAQLRQLITNLVTNAFDALKMESGKITIRTKKVIVEDPDLYSPLRATDLSGIEFVGLEVRDTGSGIAKDQMDHIFEPFFTTKPDGSGMGLASVMEIVQGNGGLVKVDSEPGNGSVFQILLPAVSDKAPARGEKNHQNNKDISRAKSVLVIESDDGVAAFLQFVLQSAGFEVLLADGEKHGVELLERQGTDIAFVLLNFSLTKNEGMEAINALKRLHISPPVLLMTGHSSAELKEHCHDLRFKGIIQKPFSPSVLLRTVQNSISP